VSWSSSAGSCGITGYDVQVRDGAGSWLDGPVGATGNQANFRGVSGNAYAFRSRARGFDGYLEPDGENPDASITAAFTPPVASIGQLPVMALTTTLPITWSVQVPPGASAVTSAAVRLDETTGLGVLHHNLRADSGWRVRADLANRNSPRALRGLSAAGCQQCALTGRRTSSRRSEARRRALMVPRWGLWLALSVRSLSRLSARGQAGGGKRINLRGHWTALPKGAWEVPECGSESLKL
jgi:hypothetical protein